MSYLAEMRKKRQEKAENAAQMSVHKNDEWLATMSNPDSNIDELAWVIQWFILPAFALWVFYIGHLFTIRELTGVVDPWQATLLSFLLPGIIQFLKLYGAQKVLRAYHFKWYDRSGEDLSLWILVALVVIGMFVWSLKISVWDVKDTAKDNFLAANSDTLQTVIAAATIDIDGQIKSIQQSNQQASTMTTKRGKIAWSGQQIQMQNSTTLSDLNKQRGDIVNQVITDYKAGKIRLEQSANHRANFFQRFGGFGELGEILFCLILGLVQAINRNANMKRLANQTNQPSGQPETPAFKVTQNGSAVNNETRSTIGFHWDGYGEHSSPDINTVSQSPQTVSQHDGQLTVLGCDAVLKQCETAVKRDLPNLNRKDAKPSTVSSRINSALEQCYGLMNMADFCPSREVGAQFYKFMVETAIPTLNERGWPYERDTFFTRRLLQVIPKSSGVEV